jgi:hypothetical protein
MCMRTRGPAHDVASHPWLGCGRQNTQKGPT